jgi:hypothetical protein
MDAFLNANHFPRLSLNQDRDYHELKGGYSLELSWLKWFFLNRLNFWGKNAFLNGNHFPRLYMNQNQHYHELKDGDSVKGFDWNHSSFISWIVVWGMLFSMQITFLDYIWIRIEIVTNWEWGIPWNWLDWECYSRISWILGWWMFPRISQTSID